MNHDDEKFKHFSLPLFLFTIFTSTACYLGLLALVAPGVWEIQIQASFKSLIITFLLLHLFNAFAEHLFHRYILHTPAIPGLAYFYKAHTRHHALTHIVYKKVTGVHNVYPIIEEKQHENSFFPWYAYAAFILFLTMPFSILQWLLPNAPIFLAGSLALAWTISLYEIFHALEHKPLEKWIPLLEHENRLERLFWRAAYAFHLRHHADIKCNEGISGFFGIPIADFLFKTWINPKTLYEHGRHVNMTEFQSPTPVSFIRFLDKWAENRIKKKRAVGAN
jgi:hemolysin III